MINYPKRIFAAILIISAFSTVAILLAPAMAFFPNFFTPEFMGVTSGLFMLIAFALLRVSIEDLHAAQTVEELCERKARNRKCVLDCHCSKQSYPECLKHWRVQTGRSRG